VGWADVSKSNAVKNEREKKLDARERNRSYNIFTCRSLLTWSMSSRHSKRNWRGATQ
jgi:hypothetical protein